MTAQQQIKATLAKSGIQHRSIACYGRQIVVTSLSPATAERWADLISGFATVRNVVQSWDHNPATKRDDIRVWRTFAVMA